MDESPVTWEGSVGCSSIGSSTSSSSAVMAPATSLEAEPANKRCTREGGLEMGTSRLPIPTKQRRRPIVGRKPVAP